MTRKQLFENISRKKSFLCIGLDTDLSKIPRHLLTEDDPVFEFNRQIIEATHDLCVAFKPNIAFYEALGPEGWVSLEKTMNCIPQNLFTIADAKRGDIGNTGAMYAKTFFERYQFDAVTLNPYMGKDTVQPFLEYPGKWVILLALTSNEGARDFQLTMVQDDSGSGNSFHLFEKVLQQSSGWGSPDKIMYVAGATRGKEIQAVRKQVPDHFLLVPGVGAQGGDLTTVTKYGMNSECGLLVNSSRKIIYAGDGTDFAQKARQEALLIKQEMERLLDNEFGRQISFGGNKPSN